MPRTKRVQPLNLPNLFSTTGFNRKKFRNQYFSAMPAGVANVEERDKMLRAIEAMKRYNAKIFYTDKEVERRFLAKKVKEARKKQYEQKVMAALSQQLEQNQTLPKDIPKRYKELLRDYLNEHHKAVPDELNIVHGPNDPLYGLIDTQQGLVTTEPFPARSATYTPRPVSYTEARDVYQQMGPRDFIVVRGDDPYFEDLAAQIRANRGKILQIAPGVFALNKKTAILLPTLMLRSPGLKNAAPYPPPVHKTLLGKTAEETYRTIGQQAIRDNPVRKRKGINSYSDIIEDLDNLDADEQVTLMDDDMQADEDPGDSVVDPSIYGEQPGEFAAQEQQNSADHQAAMTQVFNPEVSNLDNGYVPIPLSPIDFYYLLRCFGHSDATIESLEQDLDTDLDEYFRQTMQDALGSAEAAQVYRDMATGLLFDSLLDIKKRDKYRMDWLPVTPEIFNNPTYVNQLRTIFRSVDLILKQIHPHLITMITGQDASAVIDRYNQYMNAALAGTMPPTARNIDDAQSLNASGMINHFGDRTYLHRRVKPFVKFNPFESPEVMVKDQERKNEMMREKFRTEHKRVYGVDPSNDTVSTAIPTLAKPFNPQHVHLVFRPVQPPKSHYSFLYGKI